MSRVNYNFFSSRVQRTQTQRSVRTPFCLESVIVLHGRSKVTLLKERRRKRSLQSLVHGLKVFKTYLSSHPPVRLWEGLLLFVYPSLRQRLLALSPSLLAYMSVLVTISVAQSPSCLVSPHLGRRARYGCRTTNIQHFQAASPGRNGERLSSWLYFRSGFEFLCTSIVTRIF